MNDISICTVFKNISHDVWQSIEKTKRQGRTSKEEAITEERVFSSLFELPQGQVKTIEYSKPKEGREGADWEWIFIAKDLSTFSIRVQAKVINPKNNEFNELHYKTKHRGFQSDLLISQAKSNHALPLYCLYSYFEADAVKNLWGCSSHENSHKNFGCGLIDAFKVQKMRTLGNKKSLSDVSPHLVPWHCTVCCSMDNSLSLPERVRQYWAVRLGKESSPKAKRSDSSDRVSFKKIADDMLHRRVAPMDEKKRASGLVESAEVFLPDVMPEPSERIKRLLGNVSDTFDSEEESEGLRASILFMEI